jgi:hypothetical protein
MNTPGTSTTTTADTVKRCRLRLTKILPRAGFARRWPVWCYTCEVCKADRRVVASWHGPKPSGWPHITCIH